VVRATNEDRCACRNLQSLPDRDYPESALQVIRNVMPPPIALQIFDELTAIAVSTHFLRTTAADRTYAT